MDTTNTQNKKITLGLIVSWLLGCLLLLAGVISFADPSTVTAAFVCIAASCFLLPPVRGFAFNRTKRSLSAGVRVLAVLVCFVLIGLSVSDPSVVSIQSAGAEPATPAVQKPIALAAPPKESGVSVESFELQMNEHGFGKIVGSVVNNTNKQHAYVHLEFNLYDAAGAQVGSTLANINNLEPGGHWSFEAPVLEGRAVAAKLKGVTKF